MGIKEKDKLFENLPAGAVEFIKLLIKKMRYRKKVRADVQAELAAHFQDELKDCPADEEKEQKAQKLIAEFGDVKLLAVLLRRAKRRCRPLWRTAIARTFQSIGVLLLCFILYTIWFISGKPTISVDYLAQLNQMNRPQILDEDNAWPHYEKAIELYVKQNERVPEPFTRRKNEMKESLWFSDLDEDKKVEILKWLEQNQSYWDKLSIDKQKLLQHCFQDRLVPYPYTSKSGLVRRDTSPYGLFNRMDSAIEIILLEIHRDAVAKPPDYDPCSFSRLRPPILTLPNRNTFAFDPNIPLDAEIIEWFKTDVLNEDFKKAVQAGAIKHWMKIVKPDPDSIFDNLYPFEKKAMARWITDNEPAWREFVTASQKSYCYREIPVAKDQMLWTVLVPKLIPLRSLARIGFWQSQLKVEENHIGQALEDCLAIARVGRHWQSQAIIVEQLTGLSMSGLAHREMLRILAAKDISEFNLKHFQEQLSQAYPSGFPLIDIESERLGFMDLVQHTFTEGGLGGGHIIPRSVHSVAEPADLVDDIIEDAPFAKRFLETVALTSLLLIHARRDKTVEKFNEIFDKMREDTILSPYQRHINKINIDHKIDDLPKFRYGIIRLFLPALDRVSIFAYQCKALHQATVTILALKRWRLEKGNYPASLDELVAEGYIQELPMDPYSDRPLIYRITDDDFLLYSTGYNFKDDGGKMVMDRGKLQKWGTYEAGDAVFWPRRKI